MLRGGFRSKCLVAKPTLFILEISIRIFFLFFGWYHVLSLKDIENHAAWLKIDLILN